MSTESYLDANRANWDERVSGHLVAYGAEAFTRDPAAVSGVVQEDSEIMARFLPGGSVRQLTLVHLQCHIGLDTLSWARLGADAAGIDFSGEAIRAARLLAEQAGLRVAFLKSTVDAAPAALGRTFDVVYTSIGVLMWLPELEAWAQAIRELLAPGGLFFIHEMHPILAALDDERDDDLLVVDRPYFAVESPARYDDGTTYADPDTRLQNSTTYEWVHPLSEVIESLLGVGLEILSVQEHRTPLPWKALPSMIEAGGGFVLPDRSERLPLTFSIAARRRV